MKRFLSGIVALIMILTVVPAFAASATLQAFADSITAESITQNELSAFVTKDLVLPAAPEGVKKLSEAHPDIQIYVGNLDRCLNENAYICPGLGDAGDRIFGTK